MIGGGVGGLGAAYILGRAGLDVTIFESRKTLGGHANTVLVKGQPIDTGFLVYNENTYPNLIGLFEVRAGCRQTAQYSSALRQASWLYQEILGAHLLPSRPPRPLPPPLPAGAQCAHRAL